MTHKHNQEHKMAEEEKKHKKHAEEQVKPAEEQKAETKEAPEASNFPEAECEARLQELEKKLQEYEAKNKEIADKHLRAVAEMDNYRKRTAKEMENLRLNVMMDTITPFLQVFDHFSMAVAAAAASDNLKALQEGMKMIQAEFDKAFSELGVVKIDAVGKEFDPNEHEAVAQEASDTVPSGVVIKQWSFGYKTPLRLLKPAMVVVSSGPAAEKKE